MTNSGNLLYLFSFILLLFAGAVAEGLPAPCYYVQGGFNFNCTPTNPTLYLLAGQAGSVEVTCCFTGNSWNNTNQARVLVNQRDEWFYKIPQPDGSSKSMTELYPGTQYITNIEAPEESRGFQTFKVKIDFQVPADMQFQSQGTPSRVDISLDILPEPIPSNPIVVVIKQKVEPPPTIPQTIVNTIKNVVSGLTGGKGGGGPGGFMPFLQPANNTPQPAQEPQKIPEQKPAETPKEPAQQPETQQAPQLPAIQLRVPDLSLNYILIAAGVTSLLVVGILLLIIRTK